jgi:hypothetical protein
VIRTLPGGFEATGWHLWRRHGHGGAPAVRRQRLRQRRQRAVWTLLLALVHLRRGRTDEALAHARQVWRALADWRSLPPYVQPGVFAAAEVFLERLATGGRPGFAQRLEIWRMMRRVKCFGMRQPLTRPRTLLVLARYAELRGRDAQAMALTEFAAAEAARLQLPAAGVAAQAALERLKA